MKEITDFSALEALMLPTGYHFSADAKTVINCWDSTEVLACPGSGKTTVLIAKLKLISDQLPFSDGSGVCVLSHTNVAVNELKNKLGKSAEKLLSYPNFVGTIQTFVDQYITFPYLRQKVQAPIQLVNNDDFAEYLSHYICRFYGQLNHTLKIHVNEKTSRFNTVEKYLKALNITKDGDLIQVVQAGRPRKIAGSNTKTAKTFKEALERLHMENGIFRYSDIYQYAEDALNEYGDALRKVLSSRFAFVFVDEYQDCSKSQRSILDRVFLDSCTVFQRIGDCDQAIYNGDFSEQTPWQVQTPHLSIADSNRYGQEIADVLTPLRTAQEPIHSAKGTCGIKPVVLVYDDTSKNQVIPAFIQKIKENGLEKSNGIYKAVGMYQNVSGLKISDYWAQFKKRSSVKEMSHYSDYIYSIQSSLHNGDLYLAEHCTRKLLCRLFHFVWKKDVNGNDYRIGSIKMYLENNCGETYKNAILHLADIPSITYQNVQSQMQALILSILGQAEFESLPKFFMETVGDSSESPSSNIYTCNEAQFRIIFDTVYGVKGETHDATLYLETEKSKGTDIKRALDYIDKISKGKKISDKTGLYDQSRKCVYVGFSRPKKLLCLAIQGKTYEKSGQYFSNWDVVDLRSQ